MRGAISITDFTWAANLSAQPDLDECNFWQPKGPKPVRLDEMVPWIFKTKSEFGNQIIGFGLLLKWMSLSVRDAWQWFGRANGANDLVEFRRLLAANSPAPVALEHVIGCVMLVSPVFFPEPEWFPGPRDWAKNIVSAKYYDLTAGEGKRIWDACRERADRHYAGENARLNLRLTDSQRYGQPQLVNPRLGQGTFRAALHSAYQGSCAVSGDHTWPALEAAHIQPYGEGGLHETSNGLLLRADIHRLYDRHLVTVTEDYRFRVSPRLDSDYRNGRIYYEMEGKQIAVPKRAADRPDPARLQWHAERLVA